MDRNNFHANDISEVIWLIAITLSIYTIFFVDGSLEIYLFTIISISAFNIIAKENRIFELGLKMITICLCIAIIISFIFIKLAISFHLVGSIGFISYSIIFGSVLQFVFYVIKRFFNITT